MQNRSPMLYKFMEYFKIFSQLEKLWQEITLCITGRYNGPYDSELLEKLSPLLVVTLLHPCWDLKSKSLSLWNSTFSRLNTLVHPETLKPVLAKLKEQTIINLPVWIPCDEDACIVETPYSEMSMGESQVFAPVLPDMPSPKRQKGSFLNRNISPARRLSPNPKVSPVKVVDPKTHIFFSSARKNRAIDFLPIEEFAVISSPRTRSKRILTDHQKEVLKSKRESSADVTMVHSSESQDGSVKLLGHRKMIKETSRADNSSVNFLPPQTRKSAPRKLSVLIEELSPDGKQAKDIAKIQEKVDKDDDTIKISNEKRMSTRSSKNTRGSSMESLLKSGKDLVNSEVTASNIDSGEHECESSVVSQNSVVESSEQSGISDSPFDMFRNESHSLETVDPSQDCSSPVPKSSSASQNMPQPRRVSLKSTSSKAPQDTLDRVPKLKTPLRFPLKKISEQVNKQTESLKDQSLPEHLGTSLTFVYKVKKNAKKRNGSNLDLSKVLVEDTQSPQKAASISSTQTTDSSSVTESDFNPSQSTLQEDEIPDNTVNKRKKKTQKKYVSKQLRRAKRANPVKKKCPCPLNVKSPHHEHSAHLLDGNNLDETKKTSQDLGKVMPSKKHEPSKDQISISPVSTSKTKNKAVKEALAEKGEVTPQVKSPPVTNPQRRLSAVKKRGGLSKKRARKSASEVQFALKDKDSESDDSVRETGPKRRREAELEEHVKKTSRELGSRGRTYPKDIYMLGSKKANKRLASSREPFVPAKKRKRSTFATKAVQVIQPFQQEEINQGVKGSIAENSSATRESPRETADVKRQVVDAALISALSALSASFQLESQLILHDWSPSKSPSCSILKKTVTDTPPSGQSRQVSFAEPVVSGESPIREKYHSEALPTSPLISCREKSGRKGSFSRSLMRLSGYRRKLDSSPKKESPFTNLMKKPGSPVKAQLSQGTHKPTQESQLDSTGPIFPDLIGCCNPLDDILPQLKLTSSLWYRGLCQLMKGRNLNTIGDLSSLTEVQINQLPIRNPKVQTVKTTLTSYMGKHGLLKVPICEETKEALTSQPTKEDGPENVKPDEINQDQRSGTVSQDLPGENDIEQISVQEKADSQAPNVNSLVLSTLSNLKGTDLKNTNTSQLFEIQTALVTLMADVSEELKSRHMKL